DLGERRFGLILVPMQTVQLLGGPGGRARFLRRARAALARGGLCAIAIADALETFDEVRCLPPIPDIREIDGIVYASRPVAVTKESDGAVIRRVRETVDTAGRRTVEEDLITLDHLEPATLEAEGAAAGFRVSRARAIPETDDYVGSTVVMLRGGDPPAGPPATTPRARTCRRWGGPERRARAARLRALPRPHEHLRRPR